MGSVKTWTSAQTKASLSKSQTVVTTSSIHGEELSQKRGCLSGLTSCAQRGQTKGWKPLSMSTPILAALALLTILIAATIEILAQRSTAYGGLALSPSLETVPRYAMWSYLYAPNVVAVLYSLVWSWVDLDVKRMQPWFELSKEDGATAEGSLFLDYPYDFVAVAPWKALKRRHWPVVLAGTTMMLVFWTITPLQSAILGTGVVILTEQAPVYAVSRLSPVEKHADLLDPEVLNNGYAVGWLGQAMPPFMTRDYGALPVYVNQSDINASKTNWTVTTSSYSTELACWPATAAPRSPEVKWEWDFLNGKGCNATINFNAKSNNSLLYFGYWSSPFASHSLAGPDCPVSSVHNFLAVWMETANKTEMEPGIFDSDYNVTALFCEPQYFKQEVLMTVDSDTQQPIDGAVEAKSEKQLVSSDEFNMTAFEYLIGNGMPEVLGPRDLPFAQVVEQHPRLDGSGFDIPVTNMVGFALAVRNSSKDSYADPLILQEAFSSAHKYLFSLAIHQLLVNDTGPQAILSGNVTFAQTGIVVSRAYSIAVEVLLVVVSIATLVLVWLVRSSPCALAQNPSSIQRIGDLLTPETSFLSCLETVDNADESSLRDKLCFIRLSLTRPRRGTPFIIRLDGAASSEDCELDPLANRDGFYDPIRPLALRKGSGLAFTMVIALAIAFLVYLKTEEIAQRGLIRPTENFEVLQLLENYLPTIFATMTEPFWVLLTRLISMLQPFRDLWKGQAPASRTTQSTYTSIPPQIVAWRALRSRHFVLVLACSMVFMSNILTVGLGALFNEAPVTISYANTFSPIRGARFNNESVTGFDLRISKLLQATSYYQDHMYVALANITNGTPLPPWTTSDFFFQPHQLQPSQLTLGNAASYSLKTRGFGAQGNCSAFKETDVPVDLPAVPALDGQTIECPNFYDAARLMIRQSTLTRPSGLSSVELFQTFGSSNIVENCEQPLVMAFGRTTNGTDMNATMSASYGICRPVFKTAMFNVTVDPLGNVLKAVQMEELGDTLDYPEATTHQQILLDMMSRTVGWGNAQWHNDTITRDWMPYFLTVMLDSRATVDPKEPPPDVEKLRPTIEDIYRRLFAILLSLNQDLFEEPTEAVEAIDGSMSSGAESYIETRIFMDLPAFIMSMVVLALNILVASAIYFRPAAFVLPRMPSTVGSIMAFIAPSRALWKDYVRDNSTFSFGRYVGLDGRAHVGIELDPHVVPIDPASLKLEQTWLSRAVRRRRGSRKPTGPWL